MKRLLLFSVLLAGGFGISGSAQTPSPGPADPIVGHWSWIVSGSPPPRIVEIRADGTASNLQKGGREGLWKLTAEGTVRQYVITWTGGIYIDSVGLSADRAKLDGTSNVGASIQGERIDEAAYQTSLKEASGPQPGASGTPVQILTVDDLKTLLCAHSWSWTHPGESRETINFGPDGKVGGKDWVAHYEILDDLHTVAFHSQGKVLHITFADDYGSFSGFDFNGVTPVTGQPVNEQDK